MNSTALLIAQALIKFGPGLARQLAELFHKPAPTLDDWNAIFALAEKPYADYVKTPELETTPPAVPPSDSPSA